MTFGEAVTHLGHGLEALFAPFGYGQQFAGVYFPAELRNPILEAGAGRKLLELRYSGVTRLVEPYALTFKRRQDGWAREYFYAYDQTRGPSIKCFVADKIESLAVTEESFTPQFEIELAKAGDAGSTGYFAHSSRSGQQSQRLPGFRPSPRRLRTRPTAGWGMTYIVVCPYCGKRFKRSDLSTRLNPHKNTYGTPCSARIGFPG